MPNTTNFNWPTPADTDLVKDGAAAIRNLGNGVDTSLVDLKGGTTGQMLSKASNADMDFTWTAGGDLTEVQAGVGISVASGTGPIPIITNSSTDLITTAGDLLYGTAADTVARLGIGTANQVLAVNSGATAPEWKTVGASGMSLITRQVISASSGTNIDSVFTTTYKTYMIIFEDCDGSSGQADLYLQFRYGSTTMEQGYKYKEMLFSSTQTNTERNGINQIILTPNLGGSTSDSSAGQIMITRVAVSDYPMFWFDFNDTYSGNPISGRGLNNQEQTYTGIRISPSTGTFSAKVAIYGLAS